MRRLAWVTDGPNREVVIRTGPADLRAELGTSICQAAVKAAPRGIGWLDDLLIFKLTNVIKKTTLSPKDI